MGYLKQMAIITQQRPKLLRELVRKVRQIELIASRRYGFMIWEKTETMHIWVDADACPKVIKEILYRAVDRLKIPMTMVANKTLQVPKLPLIEMVTVAAGADVADGEIVKRMSAGDLVITADIPLAADVIAKEGHALNPRGTFYSQANVKQQLAMRNFMDELRGSGVVTGGPPAFSNSDRMAFANQLDRFLTRQLKGG